MVGDCRSHVCDITTMHKILSVGAFLLLFEELKVMNLRETGNVLNQKEKKSIKVIGNKTNVCAYVLKICNKNEYS